MSKLKIGVFSDTHVGYNGNPSLQNEFGELRTEKTADNGVNIRTQDVNDAFEQSIDLFIEDGVDVVCHAGDGMNFWGYKHPAHFNFYMNQVSRLTDAGIHYIEVAGNHNFAKKAGVGCDLEKLNHLPNTKTMYKGVYEPYEIPGTDVLIHGMPSSFDKNIFIDQLQDITADGNKFNILLTHCGVTSVDHYAKSEGSIVVHLDDLIELGMDLTILGDYHKFVDFGNDIYYPGATERFSFGEVNEVPRVLIFDVDVSAKDYKMRTKYLKVRPMIDLPVIDATDKKIIEVQTEIVDSLMNNPIDDAIVRLRIENLPKTSKHRHLFLTDEIIELQKRALIFKFDFKNKVEISEFINTDDDIEFDDITEGFDSFVNRLPKNPEVPNELIIKYGKKYLMEVEENEID